MRYVQSLPPEVEPVPDSGAIKPPWHVNAVHRVAERVLPPLVFRTPAETPTLPAIDRRQRPRPQAAANDRRKFCRRLQDAPVLQELRSGIDRRRRNQRKDDIITAIDEKA